MAESSNNKSFFQTLPGVLTATATLITAIVGLITVLNQVGLLGNKDKEKPKTEEVVKDDKPKEEESLSATDLEAIVRKVLKEENATKGKNKKEIEATVSEIIKDARTKTASSESVKKITRAFLSNNPKFKKEEDSFDDEPDGDYVDPPITRMVNVSGTWRDSNTGASYVFEQNGNSIVFQEHSVNAFGAVVVSAEGSGTVSSRNINVNYVTMFGTNGVASMTVNSNGSNITGTFRDNVSGVVVNMNLWR